MKRLYSIVLLCVLFFALVIWIYNFYEPCYLNLTFTHPLKEIKISKVEVTITTAEGNVNKVIEEIGEIERVIDYLNSIPLVYVEEGGNFDDSGGGILTFYDNEGLCVGWIALNKLNHIYNSRTLTTYRIYHKDFNIIFELTKQFARTKGDGTKEE